MMTTKIDAVHDYEKSYDELMIEAQFEFLHWLDDTRMQKRAEKAKYKKIRLATVAARKKKAIR